MNMHDTFKDARRWTLPTMVLSLAIGLAAPHSYAHSDAHFDAQAAPHGGRMRMAGPVHFVKLPGIEAQSARFKARAAASAAPSAAAHAHP